MKCGLLLDELYTEHETGYGHPERPERIEALMKTLAGTDLAGQCQPVGIREATDDDVRLAHSDAYLALLKREITGSSSGMLTTGDTIYSPRSLEIARKATGGLLEAVDAVMKDKLDRAFCAVRPPGHHATKHLGMGFCIFNNAAIAARYAQKTHGADRVAIIDWDVHHGNGTQDIFYDDGSVFYFSTHQHPWYPGTGMRVETGEGRGRNTTLNAPLPAGSGIGQIEAAFAEGIKAMTKFKPDLVIISAGFDSRLGDPLGDLKLRDVDFVKLTKMLIDLAGEIADGRIISVLEGGYSLEGLVNASAAHLLTLVEYGADD
jgi:acetoin utilization deacetylase AcuC-like enzyme